MRPRERANLLVRRVTLFTAIGVACTLSTVWVLPNVPYVRGGEWGPRGIFTTGESQYSASHFRGLTHERLSVSPEVTPEDPYDLSHIRTYLNEFRLDEPGRSDAIRLLGDIDHAEGSERRPLILRYRFGVPFRATECITIEHHRTSFRIEGGWMSPGYDPRQPATLPRWVDGGPGVLMFGYRVRPLQFALDVVIFAGATFVLTFVCRAIRSARRRQVGICPHCRYDLQHDFSGGCPECGWRKTMARLAAT